MVPSGRVVTKPQGAFSQRSAASNAWTPAEIVFVAAAAGLVYLSVVVHSRTVLFVATAGLLAYTAWFTGEHFADSLGWPLALVMLGLLMMAVSALAFRIDRDYVQRSRT